MKQEGFTLLELLAVIVILAMIALIATPIIMNVLEDSKKEAAKNTMYGYVKAVELASMDMITDSTNAPDGGPYKVDHEGDIISGTSRILDVNFNGVKPKEGGTITLNKGVVVDATLEFSGIVIHYDGQTAEISGRT